jgi:O-acetyl-ADP-ribose deacetylase
MEKKLFLANLASKLPVLRGVLGWTQAELAKRIGISRANIVAIEQNPHKMSKTTALALYTAVFGELMQKREQYAALNFELWRRNETTDREYLLKQINGIAWGRKKGAAVLVIGSSRDPLAGKTAHLIQLLNHPGEADKSAMLSHHDIEQILERTVGYIQEEACKLLGIEERDPEAYIKNLEEVTYHLGDFEVEFAIGDISAQDGVDIIVNASDRYLSGSGGGDRAIHQAAGPQLDDECQSLVPVQPGQAVATDAYWLPNYLIIHCVGPRYDLDELAPELLAMCYRNALHLAETRAAENGYGSIAFPSVATGTFGFPLKQAAPVALQTVLEIIPSLQAITKIRFVLFDSTTLAFYTKAWELLTKDL